MGANVEAFTNSIRKIGFWNVESRVVAVPQSDHFRVTTLMIAVAVAVAISLSFSFLSARRRRR
jgi:hypothetical protein